MKQSVIFLLLFLSLSTFAPAQRQEVEPNNILENAMPILSNEEIVGMVHLGDGKDNYTLSMPRTGKAVVELSGHPSDCVLQIGTVGFQESATAGLSFTNGKPGKAVRHVFKVQAGKPGTIWVKLMRRLVGITRDNWAGVLLSDNGPYYTVPPVGRPMSKAPPTVEGKPVLPPITYRLHVSMVGDTTGAVVQPPGTSDVQRVLTVDGLSLELPAGWTSQRSFEKSLVFSPPPGTEPMTQVKVIVMAKSAVQDRSAWQRVIREQDQLTRNGGAVLKINQTTIAGKEAPYAFVTYRAQDTKGSMVEMMHALFIWEHQQRYYSISLICPVNRYEGQVMEFRAMLASIRIESP